MSDLDRVQKRQRQNLVLSWVNLALFVVLFAGLAFVIGTAVSLVNRVNTGLDAAEESIAAVQEQLRSLEPEAIVEQLVSTATAQLDESITGAIMESEFAQTMEAIQELYQSIEGLDPDALAQQVSYNVLIGLSDGLRNAAEARNPGASD